LSYKECILGRKRASFSFFLFLFIFSGRVERKKVSGTRPPGIYLNGSAVSPCETFEGIISEAIIPPLKHRENRNHVAFAGKEHSRFDKLSLADVSHVNLFPNGAVSKQRTRDYGNIFHEEEKRGIIKMFPS